MSAISPRERARPWRAWSAGHGAEPLQQPPESGLPQPRLPARESRPPQRVGEVPHRVALRPGQEAPARSTWRRPSSTRASSASVAATAVRRPRPPGGGLRRLPERPAVDEHRLREVERRLCRVGGDGGADRGSAARRRSRGRSARRRRRGRFAPGRARAPRAPARRREPAAAAHASRTRPHHPGAVRDRLSRVWHRRALSSRSSACTARRRAAPVASGAGATERPVREPEVFSARAAAPTFSGLRGRRRTSRIGRMASGRASMGRGA